MFCEFHRKVVGSDDGDSIFGNMVFGFWEWRCDFDECVLFEEDVSGFVVDLAGGLEERRVRVGVGGLFVVGGVSVG